MTKLFCTILTIAISLTSCNLKNPELEKSIYISYISPDFSGKETAITDLYNKQYFSKEFWQYFIRKFPRATGVIFRPHSEPTNSIIHLADTSLIVNEGDYLRFWQLTNTLLPNSANENEKDNKFFPSLFIEISNDPKADKPKPPSIPKLTETIQTDYKRFVSLLQDKKHQPIFVYSKNFIDQIKEIYK